MWAVIMFGRIIVDNGLVVNSEWTTTIGPNVIFTAAEETVQAMTGTAPLITPTLLPPESFGIGLTMTGKDGMTLLYVPAGEFLMGSDANKALEECQRFSAECQLGDFTDETPLHPVFLDAFWIDQTEVTNKMYTLCVIANVCEAPTNNSSHFHSSYYGNSEYDNYPVIHVNWNMARTYCEWVGRQLPTEAQWEKAARGENAFLYPWGNKFDGTRVNSCDKNCALDLMDKSFNDGFDDTAPVGTYLSGASPYGALDMAGNTLEWVADWYDRTYYASSPYTNPTGPDSGTGRVLRGGSWGGYNESIINSIIVRSAYRRWGTPDFARDFVGFRCAVSATP